jgi:uroporphyrinogen-III decarboxylase
MMNRPLRPANWAQLTPEQKRTWRFQSWADTVNQINFVSPAARQRYQNQINRLTAAYQVREPDQVPVIISTGNLPFAEAGLDYKTAIHEPEKAVQACLKFNEKHASSLNTFASSLIFPASSMENLDYKLYIWPGHGLTDTAIGFQFVESEYMLADEYDALLRDPTDFWMRTYFPRVFGAFKPLKLIGPLTDIFEIIKADMSFLADPEMQTLLQKLLESGKIVARYNKANDELVGQSKNNGYSSAPLAGFAKAPFDTLGDTLRGTTGIMRDIYRQPAKLLKAVDLFADITINNVLSSAAAYDGLTVTYPLHKGADGWMSQKQFETFYWPSLKKTMDAFINEGMIIVLFAEGSYNTRLDYVNQFPKGTVTWWFDQSDMTKAKKTLGTTCCVQGNVPSSLIVTGSPAETREYCRKLIEACAPGGGFILGQGCHAEFPKIENLQAMVDAAHKFGAYPK